MSKLTTHLKHYGDLILNKTLNNLTQSNITFVMPAFYPQRGGILEDLTKKGGKAVIAGGMKGQQLFKSIPQFGLPFETTGIEENFENLQQVVSALPKNISGPVAVFVEAPLGDHAWTIQTQKQLKNAQVIATNEQNLRSYFEEKMNLTALLQKAGLSQYIIPQTLIGFPQPTTNLIDAYDKLKDENGKVVIQACGPGNNESGGGYSTKIVESAEELLSVCGSQQQGFCKMAKFVNGFNSNVSFFVGNTLPNPNGLGAVKGALSQDSDLYSSETLDFLLSQGQELGLNIDNIFTISVPGTLKAVGDPNLTSSPTSGVGNIINYHFEQQTSKEIYEITQRIGTVMGLCGKVGLAGIDLIITKDGEIFINEINDRQQGPTEETSLNCEKNNIPGIHHISFLQNYGDFTDTETLVYMNLLKDNSQEIYDETTKISSPFYIKIGGKFANATSKVNLQSGTYKLSKENDEWTWNLENQTESNHEICDPNADSMAVELSGISLKEGQELPKGTQIGRINGITDEDSSAPFVIDIEGNSVLNPDWLKIVDSFYSQTQTTDLRQQTIPVKETPTMQ